MSHRLRIALSRVVKGIGFALGALVLTAGIVSAATSFGTSSITTTGTLQVDGNSTFDTNTLFVDSTNNRVGIGTTSPAQMLEVATGNIALDRHPTSSPLSRSVYIGVTEQNGSFVDANAGAAIKFESVADGGNSSQSMHFKTHHTGVNAGIRMTIDKDGLVGIGTVTPMAPLEIKNTTVNAQALALTKVQSGSGTGSQGSYMLFRGGSSGTAVRGYFGFTQTATGTQTIFTGASDDAIALRSEGSLHVGSGGDNIRMTVDASGNVGVGDNTPAALFTVGNGDLFQVSSSGNVTTTGTIGVASSVANSDKLALAANATGSNAFTGTLTTADLTSARSWALPDTAGTVVIDGATQTLSGKTLASPLMTASSVSVPSAVVRAISSQTSNLMEWQDVASAVLASVSATGGFSLPSLTLGGGAAILKHLSTTGAVGNTGSVINGNDCITDVISVSGAASGDTVVATPPNGIEAGLLWSAWASGTGQVSVRLCNVTGSGVSSADLSWRVDVWKH